ncbi:glycosyltransferase family 2 protein [Paracoccus lutimaris]|uniref:Glycosyl transferase family 2 n=1 Tax=Paracoccus lutimaris TaxID=1490030 RepID=A0A368YKW6_9RHOB|nr:glycosyltransferase family 2 protein [Paracoccus lutimaris]RCW80815.1 glycosyl transferase family 2 [Paracoccus lutimaris]
MSLLEEIRPARDASGLPLVALAHNEANLIQPFLAHYRALGPMHFIIVDDHSTDATRALLEGQPDVTLLCPAPGSTYAEHKLAWRRELLDRHAAGRWVLLPDLDEHFVFAGMETQPLAAYLAALEAEGAEAVLTVMIDMYADRPLAEHVYAPDAGGNLLQAFPYFDGPAPAPHGYHFLYGSKKMRRASATPPLMVHGGLRDRLFRVPQLPVRQLALRLLDRVAGLDGPVTPQGIDLLKYRATRRLTRGFFKGALDMQKIGLCRWKPGSTYVGAHRLREHYRMSESIAAFLHFKFTRGTAGLEYTAQRGQHFAGARHYHEMLSAAEILGRSPLFAGTRRYEGSASLAGILRGVPGPDRR